VLDERVDTGHPARPWAAGQQRIVFVEQRRGARLQALDALQIESYR
jgi:hypothetical protein